MNTIICELCKEVIDVVKTPHGALVSHRKKGCKRLEQIKIIMSKDFLLKEYIEKNRTALDISIEFGFKNTNFIDDMLKKFEIPKRKIKDTGNIESVKQKRAKTTLEKYNVDNVSKLQEIKDKIKQNTDFVESGRKISESLKKKK